MHAAKQKARSRGPFKIRDAVSSSSALAGLVALVDLVDDVDAAAPAHELVGTMAPREHEAGPVTVQGSSLYAASALGHQLDTQLASAPVGDIRIGMTFRDQGGAICRTFMTPASTGLACRESSKWRVRGMFGTPEGQSGDYRMAGGMDPGLAGLVDTSMKGEPFDAAQERAAREHEWR